MNPPPFTATARRGVVTLKGRLTPPVFKFISRCPGFTKWDGNDGVLFEASRKHLELFKEAFPDFEITDADGTLATLHISTAPIAPHERVTTPNITPFAHQSRAIDIAISRESFAFFHDMGTGKSSTIINIAAELFACNRVISRALVITTKRGVPQFVQEQVPQHMPKGTRYRAAPFPSTQARNAFKYPDNNLLIAVASYGALQSKAQTELLIEFCKAAPTAIFLDESQNIKSWDSVRNNNLWKLRPYCARRYLFSGEPKPLGPIDLYSQFMFLEQNILGHNSLTSFKNQFCVLGGYKTKEIVDYKNQEELASLIAPHCEFLAITDLMDMPQRSWHDAVFEPTKQQRDLYKKMKDEFLIVVQQAIDNQADSKTVTRLCKQASSKFTVLQQIANGFFYTDPTDDGERGELIVLNDERALFVAEELIPAHGKTVVFARFHADLASLARAFAETGIAALEFSGRLNDKQNEINKIAFQTDASVRVLYATAASGGTALNLQCANRVVYFSNSYNYNDRAQSERRIWRAGQTEHCQYFDVVGFPIDRLVRANLMKKQDMSAQLTQITALAKLAREI